MMDSHDPQSETTRPTVIRSFRATHPEQLEAEAIFVLREVAAEFGLPLLLSSGGKDSIVVSHFARKAFWPGAILFPLLYVDTDLGDMACTGAVVAEAVSVGEIIREIAANSVGERGALADDQRSSAAMEDRKREGYF